VLLARPLHPEHVVEEEVGTVRRGEALELEIGTVEHHLAQAPDLGIDVECHRGHAFSFLSFELLPSMALGAAASGGSNVPTPAPEGTTTIAARSVTFASARCGRRFATLGTGRGDDDPLDF